VLYKQLVALIGGAVALTLATTEPVYAQTPGQTGTQTGPEASERVQPQRRGRSLRREPAAPTPEQNLTAARAMLSTLGKSCQATEASYLGQDAQRQKLYEVACSDGPGYLLLGSTPPTSMDCFELAGAAASTRARDPEAPVGQQCALPANDNALAVIGGWAREAGATCTIDEVLAVGRTATGQTIYEIGCANDNGYRLERADTGWKLQDCMELASANVACQFTTPAEQIAGFRSKLANTDAAGCDIQELRLMGHNANGRFYEAKCAVGDGYIARVDTAGVTQQVYACDTEQARVIGGGCTLTPATTAASPES
jgi:hypothetical protein